MLQAVLNQNLEDSACQTPRCFTNCAFFLFFWYDLILGFDAEATKDQISLIRFRLFRYPKQLFDFPARKGLTAFWVHYRLPGQWRLQLPSVYMALGVKPGAYDHQHVK
jgi:hypothetical protein